MTVEAICPLCNGLENRETRCPNCAGEAVDCGRTSDYYGPYSPYRPVEAEIPNVAADAFSIQPTGCDHTMYCLSCGFAFTMAIHATAGLG